MLAAGIHPKVVQERLGHSSISITLDIYSHLMPNMQGEAANAVDGVFRAAINKNSDDVGSQKGSNPCREKHLRTIFGFCFRVLAGRSGEARTPNPRFWRPVLYQLSYTPSDLNLLTFPCPRKELSANIGELSPLYSTEA